MSDADKKLSDAVIPKRSLLVFTLTATLPIIVITAILFLTPVRGRALAALALIGAITGFYGLGRLLYEITLDIAGYPDFKLPVWAVFYLIVYVISAFAFLFFGLHLSAPGAFFTGFKGDRPEGAFLDALYISLCDYIGVTPDVSFTFRTRGTRFLTVIQGVISLFINVVIIAKFVNTF